MSRCRLTVTVRPVRDAAELDAAQKLRVKVFCEEQGVSCEVELDGLDGEAIHLVAIDEKDLLATCRLRFVEEGCKLERMAVGRRYRDSGVGAKLLAAAEAEARERGAEQMLLHSQTAVRGFYERCGYRALSEEVFLEDGIEHVRMGREL